VEEDLDEELNELSDLEGIDDDLSDMEFNGEDEEMDEESHSGKRKLKNTVKKISKKLKALDDKTFVSAEEFAEMLEEQGHSKFKYGASNMYSDRDGAAARQLDWETERNERISGFRGGKKGPKLSNKFKAKRSNKAGKSQRPVKRKK
jgi:ribosome biogenesis protein MAK21